MPKNPSAIKSSQVRWSLTSHPATPRPSALLAVPWGAQYNEGCGDNYFGEGGGLEAASALVVEPEEPDGKRTEKKPLPSDGSRSSRFESIGHGEQGHESANK